MKSKRKLLNNRLHIPLPILKSKFSIRSKLLLYTFLLKKMWTSGTQIWISAKPSHTRTIQLSQSIILCYKASNPWYITNKSLQDDLNFKTVEKLAIKNYKNFYS